jgi:hypothetical protein
MVASGSLKTAAHMRGCFRARFARHLHLRKLESAGTRDKPIRQLWRRVSAWASQMPFLGVHRGLREKQTEDRQALFKCADKMRTVVPVWGQLTHAFLVCSARNS